MPLPYAVMKGLIYKMTTGLKKIYKWLSIATMGEMPLPQVRLLTSSFFCISAISPPDQCFIHLVITAVYTESPHPTPSLGNFPSDWTVFASGSLET